MQASRFSHWSPIVAPARWLCGLIGAGLTLSGCSDRTADLQQQITSLQNELERSRKELEAVQKQATESTGAGGGTREANAMNREEIERSYEEAGRVFRTGLEAQLTDVQMGNFTLYRPEVEPFPYRSEFSMEVRLRGKPLQIDRIPVKGGMDGKWTFPTVSEVSALIDRLKNSPPSALSRTAEPLESSSGTSSRTETAIAAPAASNQTVVVQWGDAPPARGATSSAPQRGGSPVEAPAAPREPAAPTKVMPASRDVQIKF